MKRLDKLDMVEAPDGSVPMMNINFDVATQPGKIVHTLTKVSKSYGSLNILNNASAEISRGDKIALIGANGRGKSTLLRVIDGRETIDGESKKGHNVEESFYAQHQLEALTVENEVLEEMKMAGTGKNELELRQLLGCFLFSGDDVFKKIKVLSGGEKARVALAKVIAAKGNFLMLDEPTNHLDMQSVEMLIDALNKYGGTFILVSHDRYFISKTANKIWEIDNGEIKEFVGSYDEWMVFKKEKADREAALAKQGGAKKEPIAVAAPVKEKKTEPVPAKTVSDTEKRNLQKELLQKQKNFQKIEADVNRIVEEKKSVEALLGDPAVYADKDQFVKLDTQYKALTAKHEELNKTYDKIFEEIMELEEKM